MQKNFHYDENLFSTKRKTFFNEVKIFFHRYENTEVKAQTKSYREDMNTSHWALVTGGSAGIGL
ncbi:MAG: hypothetical protein IKB96_08775, partial [Prevotella sp.]|nr:hypothetical protein [Prevotella sp.]